MNIKEITEQMEQNNLSPYAVLSKDTQGRKHIITQCSVRTEFQRDRDRILHSKAFRRLKHKTQVFISPEGDHYRTRLTHTLEVSQIARTIARGLRLNEDLVEAIALGHDLGHTPFGHAGEDILNSINEIGFEHNKQSLRVVDKLEGSSGLNLTLEVRDGILNHTGDYKPSTLEGQIVKFSDRIAYINHDIDDAIRARLLCPDDLPEECVKVLGQDHGKRINTMILDIIVNSQNKNEVTMGTEVKQATHELRTFMFNNVYLDSTAKKEEKKVRGILEKLYLYYLERPLSLPNEYHPIIENEGINRGITDYIAGMTDRYAVAKYMELFVPLSWR
jgi:dGTPase